MKEHLKHVGRVALLALVVGTPLACSSKGEDDRICIGQLRQSEFNNALNSASNKLSYDDKDLISVKPLMYDKERFPNGVEARAKIKYVIDNMGDKGNVDDRLRQIHDSIPNEVKVRKLNNKNVTEKVFSDQRRELSRVKIDAESFINICPPNIQ